MLHYYNIYKVRTLLILYIGIHFLSGNHIAEISADDFEGFNRYLLSLSMASNSLVEIPNDVFKTLKSLRSLSLQDNNIRSIRHQAFQVSNTNLATNILKNTLLI